VGRDEWCRSTSKRVTAPGRLDPDLVEFLRNGASCSHEFGGGDVVAALRLDDDSLGERKPAWASDRAMLGRISRLRDNVQDEPCKVGELGRGLMARPLSPFR